MVSLKSVEQQLKQIGCNFKFWGRPEIVELSKILVPEEKIAQCVNGMYEGGFALLCVTDARILLIDKKPLYLTLDDIRFDMLTDINYSHRLLDASIHIMTSGNKTLHFTAYNQARLRVILDYIQQRVTEVRRREDQVKNMELQIAKQLDRRAEAGQALPPAPVAPQAAQATAPAVEVAIHDMATANVETPYKSIQKFNGWRHQVALQVASSLGPRAVAFSQRPPALPRYKLPLGRRYSNQ